MRKDNANGFSRSFEWITSSWTDRTCSLQLGRTPTTYLHEGSDPHPFRTILNGIWIYYDIFTFTYRIACIDFLERHIPSTVPGRANVRVAANIFLLHSSHRNRVKILLPAANCDSSRKFCVVRYCMMQPMRLSIVRWKETKLANIQHPFLHQVEHLAKEPFWGVWCWT